MISYKKNPYKSFPKFVLRAPIMPLNLFFSLTSEQTISDKKMKEFFLNPIVKEAIFLASPSLYMEAEKWIIEDEKNEKLKYTLLKYITRMSSRCTPFGLFAGCAVGNISQETSIELNSFSKYKRKTRFDMNFLMAFSHDLVKIDRIRHQVLFYPNSSIYTVGNQLRYIEYNYFNSRRQHHISAVDRSIYVQKVIKKAEKGACIDKLVEEIADDDINTEDAVDFINELIDEQILVSELEPAVSGPDFFDQIISILEKKPGLNDLIELLLTLKKDLEILDKKIGNEPNKYFETSKLLNNSGTSFDLQFLFQTDLEISCKTNHLNFSVTEAVRKGMIILNKMTSPSSETNLTKFKDAFLQRYEDKEVSLSVALDTEIGIGYLQGKKIGVVNPLIDDLILSEKDQDKTFDSAHRINDIQKLVYKKIVQSIEDKKQVVSLTDDDFQQFKANWEDGTDTVSALIQLVNLDGKEKIKFSGYGGSSAANLMSRFCLGNQSLKEYVEFITEKEEMMNNTEILAEIVHLPESRVGNILMRPNLRKTEIPYLAKSLQPNNEQLNINDLKISVRNNRIHVRSISKGKDVLPCLTNAHNYQQNSLPIYEFLSDMQVQNKRGGYFFDLGVFLETLQFVPRVEYEDIILQEATWFLNQEDIKGLLVSFKNEKRFLEEKNTFLKEKKIPQLVKLVEGDNELVINFQNVTSAKMLIDTVKNKGNFTLTEFLFDENSIVRNKEAYFTNQILVSFFNKNRIID